MRRINVPKEVNALHFLLMQKFLGKVSASSLKKLLVNTVKVSSVCVRQTLLGGTNFAGGYKYTRFQFAAVEVEDVYSRPTGG